MPDPSSYEAAGVHVQRWNDTVDQIRDAVAPSLTPQVLSGVGGFGALYELSGYRQPVLVSSTDGVGTKVKLAIQAGRPESVGTDIVNHCVNDILTMGARPLFFLDYVGLAELVPAQLTALVANMAAACKAVGCALIGGETAEMPGLYSTGDFDLAGFIVGVVERDQIIDGRRDIRPGDALVAMPSSGLHTNGYSLVRRIFGNEDLGQHMPELGGTLADVLLEPHRCYLDDVMALRQHVQVKGLAHITGGGFTDNIPRILPKDCGVVIHEGSWMVPPIFRLLSERVTKDECYRVFNMGVGMVVVVPAAQAAATGLPVIGEVTGQPGVRIV